METPQTWGLLRRNAKPILTTSLPEQQFIITGGAAKYVKQSANKLQAKQKGMELSRQVRVYYNTSTQATYALWLGQLLM
jgi:hypothetical protein